LETADKRNVWKVYDYIIQNRKVIIQAKKYLFLFFLCFSYSRFGAAWLGMAWCGMARRGKARQGKARFHSHCLKSLTSRFGEARLGEAWRGVARQGKVIIKIERRLKRKT
jgi:hypothetical protein